MLRSPRLSRLTGALPALALAALLALSACDAGAPQPHPIGPTDIPPTTADQGALVASVFAEIEGLFDLGWGNTSSATATPVALDQALTGVKSARVDTTTYTGIYDLVNAKGYLVQLSYREPQGVGVWTGRVQHARDVDHDNDAGTADLEAVESFTLTFLNYGDLNAFVTALQSGTIAYLAGTSDDAAASFSAYDTWRVAQAYSPGVGEAVVGYTNAELRESVTIREPVVTLNTDGTGTVRDGGADGAIRTRYFGADFGVAADGTFSGTLLRTLSSSGDTADGSLVSRNVYPDASFRQTKQRGGDGVVVRENTEG